jgi:RimJ/RimL family protein N-acetyltransferase
MRPAPVEIVGAHIRLRPFTTGDIGARYLGWLNDSMVVRYSNQRFVTHDAASCGRYLDSFAGTANLFLAIEPIGQREPIGTMTAYRATMHGTADMGIMIGDRAVWGKGYGQDAWDTLLGWLLDDPAIRKVTAGTLGCNAAMLRLIERSNMALEGVRIAQEIVDDRPRDIRLFARFR